ncbi:MAG: HAMP domain-containing histidine kinase [Dorea sp.]|jgi:two-component system sensor histidine kinase SenX3|nr:HAMP domain-containing histidine kinase [Dorea sp.]
MFGQRTLDRLDRMLDEAIAGTFKESDYDESKLSKVESKWKQFLGASVLSRENVEKEKNRVKELVSDISHQTKTPMANIRLYTELLKETDRQDSLKLLEEIDRQVEKLGFLIQSLTKISRLESNIVEVKPKQQRISELLDTVIGDILPKAGKKDVEIVNTYTGSGTAYYDMKWTKEALGNIVDNAVKYSLSGSRVILSVTEYDMYAAVSVRDFGMGIRETDTARIFQRFYRAENVHEKDGVGIGLYLAREIIRRENGYIKVRSKVGKGSEFILHLQRRQL